MDATLHLYNAKHILRALERAVPELCEGENSATVEALVGLALDFIEQAERILTPTPRIDRGTTCEEGAQCNG